MSERAREVWETKYPDNDWPEFLRGFLAAQDDSAALLAATKRVLKLLNPTASFYVVWGSKELEAAIEALRAAIADAER